MKYALIGCGRISPNHMAAAINNKLEIVAVCDLIDSHMDNILEKFNLDKNKVKKYSDYKEMIEKEELDLIGIATESGKHAQIAVDCIEKGINVILAPCVNMMRKV